MCDYETMCVGVCVNEIGSVCVSVSVNVSVRVSVLEQSVLEWHVCEAV